MKAPTIESDGSFGEVDTERLDQIVQRVKLHSSEEAVIYKIARPNDPTFSMEVFYPKKMAYKIDQKRMAEVTIFIHDSYFKRWPVEVRHAAIEKHIKEAGPWVFTYGERIKLEGYEYGKT